jgi:hypothetical protein
VCEQNAYLDVAAVDLGHMQRGDGTRRVALVGKLDDGEATGLAVHVRENLALHRTEHVEDTMQLSAGESPRKVAHVDIMS